MNKKRSSQVVTSTWKKIALVLFGLILFLVLLETGLRLGGFVLLSIQEYGNLRSLKQKSTFRILCLGESTTQGQYPQPLEKILSQRNTGVRFSVIDKGRMGICTLSILNQVESFLDEYHPDAVVAMMGINDRGNHVPFEVPTASKGTLFVRSFKIYKLTRLLWLHLLTKAKEMGFYKPEKGRQSSKRIRASLAGTLFKETSAKPVWDEKFFKRSIEIDPRDDGAYVGLGWLYRDQGKFPQAEDLFRKAIELDPENDGAYFLLGELSREQKKFREAESFLKKAIELDPRNGDAYLKLGQLYRDQDKSLPVENLFRKAIEFNPKNENAYFELGQLYQREGKFSQAEDLVKRAVENNPGNEIVFATMALLCEEMGRPKLAKEYAEKANQLRLAYYLPVTVKSYRKLKKILDKKGIRLVCVQYPMRNVEPLKRIFGKDEGVIFVDNEGVFKEAVKRSSYKEYFSDMFAGDFGHCTQKGNELLANNIADVILREIFDE